MADFEVRANQLSDVASQLNSIQKSIKSVSSQVNSVLRQTRGSITARIGAALQRTVVCANINNCATDMKNLSQGLNEAVQYYLAYEKNVYNKTFGKTVKVKSKSLKNKWEQFKDTISDKVKGISKAVKEKVENIKSAVKNTAKKLWEGIKDTASKTWDFVKDTAGKVKDNFVTAYNYLKNSYNEHGWVYDVVQYGKAAIKIVGGVATIVTSVASTLATGGLSTPAAVVSVIYGLNEITNGVADIVNVASDNYDKVGEVDLLKTVLGEAGGAVGELLGNEDVGRAIGEGVYNVGKIYVAAANIKVAVDKINGSKTVDFGDAWDSAKDLGGKQVSVKEIMTTDIGDLKKGYDNLKTAGEYKAFFDWNSRAKDYVDVVLDTAGVTFDSGDAAYEFYNDLTGSESSNAAISWYNDQTAPGAVDEVTGAYSDVNKIKESLKTFKEYYDFRKKYKIK